MAKFTPSANVQSLLSAADYAAILVLLAHTHNDLYFTESEVTSLLADKQDELVSATSIKTVNGSSLLGSGDLVVSGGLSQAQTLAIASLRI